MPDGADRWVDCEVASSFWCLRGPLCAPDYGIKFLNTIQNACALLWAVISRTQQNCCISSEAFNIPLNLFLYLLGNTFLRRSSVFFLGYKPLCVVMLELYICGHQIRRGVSTVPSWWNSKMFGTRMGRRRTKSRCEAKILKVKLHHAKKPRYRKYSCRKDMNPNGHLAAKTRRWIDITLESCWTVMISLGTGLVRHLISHRQRSSVDTDPITSLPL